MNAIFEHILQQRSGHYCHCVEVSDVYELECIAEAIIGEYAGIHSEETIIEFLDSLTIYCLNDSNEAKVYDFSFREFINGTI